MSIFQDDFDAGDREREGEGGGGRGRQSWEAVFRQIKGDCLCQIKVLQQGQSQGGRVKKLN